MVSAVQRRLSNDQVREFYHDHFVASQVRDFLALVGPAPCDGVLIADIGGGCGFFAKAMEICSAYRVRVLDADATSVETCHQCGIDASISDARAPVIHGDESVASFNLILHHLVGETDGSTRKMQVDALRSWVGHANCLFVNEYVYESYLIVGLSSWLIYRITSSAVLSSIARVIARLIPSLRANTFGVGVRFRSAKGWVALFVEAGFEVTSHIRGNSEFVSIPRRLLCIRDCRRDSYLLVRREQ